MAEDLPHFIVGEASQRNDLPKLDVPYTDVLDHNILSLEAQNMSSWMGLGDGRAARREELLKYRELIRSGEFDGPLLIRHGHLLEYEICAVHFERSEGNGQPVFTGHPAALRTVEALSTSIFPTITPNYFLECELQYRNLLASMLLLEAHGVHGAVTERLQALQTNFVARFTNLRFNVRAVSTYDRFRKAQSSVFLYASTAFLQRFSRAEPGAIAALRNFVHLASFALNVAGPALGNANPNLRDAFDNLKGALDPFWTRPTHKFDDVFTVFQATLLLGAFSHVTTVKQMSGETTNESNVTEPMPEVIEARVAVETFARRILERISERLGKINVRSAKPPRNSTETIQAILGSTHLRFRKYHAAFMLLDCATTLKNIPSARCDEVKALEEQATEIAKFASDSTLRCKALEFVLTCNGYPHRQIRELHMNMSPRSPVNVETTLMLEYLYHRRGIDCHQRRSSTTSFASYTPPTVRINRADWIEADFDVQMNVEESPHPASHPTIRKNDYTYCCMSPSGEMVLFLRKNRAALHGLRDQTLSQELARSLTDVKSAPYRRAALTNDYAAILARETVKVSLVTQLGNENLTTIRPCSSRGWMYSEVAIQRAGARTLLAVASGDCSQGRIEIFEIFAEAANAAPFLWNLNGNFGSSGLDLITDLRFSQDCDRLSCVRNNSTVLVWQLVCGRPVGPPFCVARKFERGISRSGITSVIPFNSPVGSRPYILSTTAPSQRRVENEQNLGEWSYIEPSGPGPCTVPMSMIHSMANLGRAGAMVAGAVAPQGNIVGLAEKNGELWLCPLQPNDGQLRDKRCGPQGKGVSRSREHPACVSMRFVPRNGYPDQLDLVAVDNNGRVVRIRLQSHTIITERNDSDPAINGAPDSDDDDSDDEEGDHNEDGDEDGGDNVNAGYQVARL